jgi:hypothetical protein
VGNTIKICLIQEIYLYTVTVFLEKITMFKIISISYACAVSGEI